ncbi:hypothetical protein F2P81_019907 [Scophthalmus maximus]|uniref:Protein STPG4 n=1 Tax=Scophthalmus maximus TaxID=52904 RepID=A0A6A4RWJ9_SCOMX|nr:hypothetical protein F2P81_019907 [Scophthalmus maximus]
MGRAQDTVTWKDKAVSKVGDMSRGGDRADKDTPLPGLYHIRDFIQEADLNPVRRTYGFKAVGRKAQTLGVRDGDLLLPGAYDYTDSTQKVLMRPASYSFKNCPRPDIDTLGIRDKHINTSPCDYNVTAKPVEKIPCKHVMFRSTVQRISFPPKSPGPGAYEPHWKLGDRLNTQVVDPSFSLFFRSIP